MFKQEERRKNNKKKVIMEKNIYHKYGNSLVYKLKDNGKYNFN